jgi:hypothetical protein
MIRGINTYCSEILVSDERCHPLNQLTTPRDDGDVPYILQLPLLLCTTTRRCVYYCTCALHIMMSAIIKIDRPSHIIYFRIL